MSSLFKQAQNAILLAVSKLKADSSSSTPASPSPDSADDDTKNTTSQKIILTPSTSSKECLISAQLYQQQGDLNTALIIYAQGLQSIPSDDPEYPLLLKEKQKIAGKLKQRNKDGFYHLLPYDVLYMIFGYLEYKDLLHCSRICRRWFDFMMEWPDFWDTLTSAMPNMDQSTLITLLHGQTQELRLEAPIDPGVVHDIFSFLGAWEDNNFIQTIYLKKVDTSIPTLRLLEKATKCMLTSLKQIEWMSCRVKQEDILRYILPVCSPGLTGVSFSLNAGYVEPQNNFSNCLIDGRHFTITLYRTPPDKQQLLLSSTPDYLALTYIKLGSYYHPRQLNEYSSNGLYITAASLVKKCPNLVHLFLASNSTDARNISRCLLEVIKSCPHLKNLVIYKNANMPRTIMSDIDENEYGMPTAANITPPPKDKTASSTTTIFKKSYKSIFQLTTQGSASSTTRDGIRRFVFGHYNMGIESKDFIEVFKHSYASLELLYLGYDGMVLGPIALDKLASFGCPRLKEIRISTGDSHSVGGEPARPVISVVLKRLFSGCPSLEVIKLEESPKWTYRHLKLNGDIVETIAKKCPRLRHFHIIDFDKYGFDRNLWRRGFLSFINEAPSQLECLKMTKLDHETAYALVKNLESLKYLQIRWWIENSENTSDEKENMVEQMNNILTGRGGSLVVDPING
ncbi:hypothetical protein BDA99DRAFT_543993 [Phascolomyces articulosus]|uniref:F-box domain-containing protein n=1 Tax=Phascolomyces articulosus TaxID=60185 RepID=A0AAD5JM34_9FUNG|nr:hypothetical protein BDA99DRAFT_543993 [Phascolomyces articulosus]